MQNIAVSELRDDDLVAEDLACRIVGGEHHPIHRSTLWRGIRSGLYPQPLKVGPSTNRWKVGELRAVIARAADARRDQVAA